MFKFISWRHCNIHVEKQREDWVWKRGFEGASTKHARDEQKHKAWTGQRQEGGVEKSESKDISRKNSEKLKWLYVREEGEGSTEPSNIFVMLRVLTVKGH